jgi:hypothetical protein
VRVDRQVRGREPERAAAAVARHDDALELERPAEQLGRTLHLSAGQQRANPARRDARHELDVAHVEAEPPQQDGVPLASAPEAEVPADEDDARPERAEHAGCELLRREQRELRGELDEQQVLDTDLPDQLAAALRGREQLHLVAEHEARVRVERDHRRSQARRDRGRDHGAVPAVDAVERADGDRALCGR